MSDITHLAQELSRLGTRRVFGIPGEGPSLELIDELEKRGGTFHSVGHEATGALMAGGWGRATGLPGVCLSIKGPGFSNMLAGVASNWLDRNPVLSLSESYGPGSSPNRMHKRMAHAAMVRPVVKAYADSPAPDLLSELWSLALAEEPGPVHIDISPTLTERRLDVFVPEPDLQPLPRALVDALSACTRPLVITGSLAARRAWRAQLGALRIPVLTTVAAKGAIDERGPWAAGIFTNAGGPLAPESTLLREADLIVGLGLRTTELLSVRPLPARLVLVDEVAGRGNGLEPVIQAVAKEHDFDDVLALLRAKHWGAEVIQTARTRLEDSLQLDGWMPAGALKVAQTILPESTRFVLDTGSFCTVGEHVLAGRTPGQIMGSACGRSMGISLPVGVGAAFNTGSSPTVVVVGDGGIRMYPECIEIAARERLPVLVLLMRDGYYASVRQAAVSKRYRQTPLRLSTCSWTTVFQGWGCLTERVESLASLVSALRGWTRSDGPLVMELVFDADRYLTMTEGLR